MREAKAVVKQQLKKERVFFIRRTTRQVSRLLNKHGEDDKVKKNKRKADRLADQIKLAKDVDLDALAEAALQEGVSEDRLAQLQTLLGQPLSEDRLHRQLILADRVQKSLQTIDDKKDEEGKESLTSCKSKKELAETAKRKREARWKEQKEKRKERKATKVTPHQGGHSSDGESDIPSGMDDLVASASDVSTDDSPMRGRELSSLFVGSMKDQLSAKKKVPKKLKNRPSQRARQKIWEKKFGQKARHIVENRPANKPRRFGDRKKTSRERKPTEESQTRGKKIAKTDTSSSSTTGELHPSWAAHRQAKQEATNIAAFQGTRVTFDDSD